MSILKKVIKAVTRIFQFNKKVHRRKAKRPSTVLPRKNRPQIKSKTKKKVLKKVLVKRTKAVKASSKPAKSLLKPSVLIGEVTHYFDKIKVCVIRIDDKYLKRGEKILIRGAKGYLVQSIVSMQIENEDVFLAKKGQLIGLKVTKAVYVKDQVYKVQAL